MTHDELRAKCLEVLKTNSDIHSKCRLLAVCCQDLLDEVAPLLAERDKLKDEVEQLRTTIKTCPAIELEAQLKATRKALSSIRWTAETHTKGILGTQNFKNVPMQQIIDQADKALEVYEDDEVELLYGAYEESVRVTRKNVELYQRITELEAQLKATRKASEPLIRRLNEADQAKQIDKHIGLVPDDWTTWVNVGDLRRLKEVCEDKD